MKLNAHDTHRFRCAPGLALVCAMACSGTISAPDTSMAEGNAAGSAMDSVDNATSQGNATSQTASPEAEEPPQDIPAMSAPPEETPAMEMQATDPLPPEPSEEVAAPPPPPPVVCDAVRLVLQPRCGDSDCHRGVGIGNFGLGEEEAASYVDKAPVSNAPICGLMIDSVNPERSFILTKVTGGPPYNPDDCKDLMPIGPPLPDSEIDCLRSWLQQFEQ